MRGAGASSSCGRSEAAGARLGTRAASPPQRAMLAVLVDSGAVATAAAAAHASGCRHWKHAAAVPATTWGLRAAAASAQQQSPSNGAYQLQPYLRGSRRGREVAPQRMSVCVPWCSENCRVVYAAPAVCVLGWCQ